MCPIRILTICLLLIPDTGWCQQVKSLEVGNKFSYFKSWGIKEDDFEVQLSKETHYLVEVSPMEVDIQLTVLDKKHNLLQQDEEPNRKGDYSIVFTPRSTGSFFLKIKSSPKRKSTDSTKYGVRVSKIPQELPKYTAVQLKEDLKDLKLAYLETKVGMWYNSYKQLDSLFTTQRKKIRDSMSALDFFKIIAPIVAFTKEGHSYVVPSLRTNNYLKAYGTYLPLFIRIINKKVYVLNNYKKLGIKGAEIIAINGMNIGDILNKFITIEPADGYNMTSKYYWIARSFSKYLLEFYGKSPNYKITYKNPKTHQIETKEIPSLLHKAYYNLYHQFKKQHPFYYWDKASYFEIDSKKNYALLTINSFDANLYGGKKGFKKYLDSIFSIVNYKEIENLIIDVRKNEGGQQGMEDILLSHLIKHNYKKYKYVKVPELYYSFFNNQINKGFSKYLREDWKFKRENDGRILSQRQFSLPPSSHPFLGQLYILIDGLTFSGGSEFAALAKNHTNAIFVGEETGGGYYGNTSGNHLRFTLPNSGILIGIPLFKFVVNVKDTANPYGHGLIPDYHIEPTIESLLDHTDTVLKYTIKHLIK